jgi:hypothetical protein
VKRAVLALLVVASASTARAQERSTEESIARHVFDEGTPLWEADAEARVRLDAPAASIVCRQGRVVPRDGFREVHMGCWPATDALTVERALTVPSGAAYLAIRHGAGADLSWIGGGPVTLLDAHTLRLEVDDHESARVAGWVVLATGLAGCIAGLVIAAATAHPPELAWVVTGLASLGVGLSVGIPLAAWGDGVRVSVVPEP